MVQSYNHKTIEARWQKFWDKKQLFTASNNLSKNKYYCLVEFPYPSGDGLHVGHLRSYTALDVLAHKRRMEGYNVLYPMGWDAFGLPSENYAIKTGVHPAVTTEKNIKNFKRQLTALGFSFDWSREVATTDPQYYRWTQWIFLKLFEHGLAYKDKISINWCPSCKIGLANEEVVSGKCERCGTPVERRLKEQWMIRITKYADRLIEDLDTVEYLDRIKVQQLNWIGRSEGAEVLFTVADSELTIPVFTTRIDTIFSGTFVIVAPEHRIIQQVKDKIANWPEVEQYIERARHKSDLERTELTKEKDGVPLQGVTVTNPATNELIPVWVSDFVLLNYGTGAVFADAHDQRDFDLAKKYGITLKVSIAPDDKKLLAQVKKLEVCYQGEGELFNSGQFNGLTSAEARPKIIAWLHERKLAQPAVNYKLRDWVFSRQRYWGEPIPMVNCSTCGWVPLREKDLPLELPAVDKYEPSDSGESPLALIDEWVNTTCPQCGGPARRETDTMPNWAGSNWYFLRYLDPKNKKALADADMIGYWMPVDWYNGGMEHTTLHLLYSRFIYKFLYDIGAIPKQCGSEPYKKRTSHGLILGVGGEKMSKSKGNVVNPDDVVEKYGADTMRLYEMFMGPFDQAIPWDEKGVVGVRRFLEKVWHIFQGRVEIVDRVDDKLLSLTHRTIKKVGDDIESQDYNTAVSALMILVNEIIGGGSIDSFVAGALLTLLAPFAPHLSEELWSQMGNKKSIFVQDWPIYDEQIAQAQEIELVVQINGKVRDTLLVPADITQQRAESIAREQQNVAKYLEGQTVKNVIFVPGRLINFVLDV